MHAAVYPAIFFTVVLLVTTAYFLMGGLPLLILQHDTAVDGKFIRRFFDIYYKAAFAGAVGACLSYALWGRLGFALGMGVVAGSALVLRKRVLPAMELLGSGIQANDPAAVRRFRKVHCAALLANLVLLMVLVWGLMQLSL